MLKSCKGSILERINLLLEEQKFALKNTKNNRHLAGRGELGGGGAGRRSGGAMFPGKTSYCACSGCGWGLFPAWGRPDID